MSNLSQKVETLNDLTCEDILDSRDLEKLLDGLENDEELDDDGKQLLKALSALREECESSGWPHGIAFIRETYWVEYCRDFADDVGYIGKETKDNPLMNCIDWDKWAKFMAQDYQTVEIDGVDYYWREA